MKFKVFKWPIFTVVINHTPPSAQKTSRQNLVLVDVNHLRLLANCMYYNMQNLPEKIS